MKKRTVLPWDTQTTRDRAEGKYVRERSDDLYHSPRWTKLSKIYRDEHPLCAECFRQGIIAPAECVDHIIPFPICEDFFDTSNLQSLCHRCNMLKGEKDRVKIIEYKRLHPNLK